MTDYASEMAGLFGGKCSVENKDWNAPRYFDSTADCYASETALMESLTSEAFNTYGFTVQYFVKNVDIKRDPLWAEDPLANIVRRFELQMYAEQIPTLQKQYDLQGMVYTEVITCQCTIAHFDEASRIDYETGSPSYEPYIPKIGDLVYMQYSGLYYEIINVKPFTEGTTFLGKPITYTFSLRVWRNDHETVDAFHENADSMEDIRSYAELGETFNLDTETETHDQTYNVTHESDYLSINTTIKEDVDKHEIPMDNVESHVEYKPKHKLEEQTDIDPFAGW